MKNCNTIVRHFNSSSVDVLKITQIGMISMKKGITHKTGVIDINEKHFSKDEVTLA